MKCPVHLEKEAWAERQVGSPQTFHWCHFNKISLVFKAPAQEGEVDAEKNAFFRIAVGIYKTVPFLSFGVTGDVQIIAD